MKELGLRLMDFGKVVLLATVIGFSAFAAREAGAQGTVPAVTATVNDNVMVSNVLYSVVIGGANATAGWAFNSSQDLLVTSLGGLLLGDLGLSSPIQVGLWAADGTLLRSVTITSGSQNVNGSLYQAIAPISLVAGDTYIVGTGTAGNFNFAEVPADKTQPMIHFEGPAGSVGNGFSFPTEFQPTGPNDLIIFGANFLFQPVPEPGVAGLLAIGGAGLIWRGRRL